MTDERNDSSNQRVCTSSNGHDLSVVKAMSVPQARDMMGTGNKLVIFCKYSIAMVNSFSTYGQQWILTKVNDGDYRCSQIIQAIC